MVGYLCSQDVLVDARGEDGGSGQQGRVGGRHHSRRHGADADDGDVGGGEVAQGDGQDHTRLSTLVGRRGTIGSQVPVCGSKDRRVERQTERDGRG